MRIKHLERVNFVIDILMLIVLAVIAGIGFLIKYALPPGRAKILKYGANTDMYFLGLDRHQWGSIHLIAGYIMLGLLVLHVVLHWKMIEGLARNLVPGRTLRWTLGLILVLLIAGLIVFGFAVTPTRANNKNFLYRNIRGGAVGNPIPPAKNNLAVCGGFADLQ